MSDSTRAKKAYALEQEQAEALSLAMEECIRQGSWPFVAEMANRTNIPLRRIHSINSLREVVAFYQEKARKAGIFPTKNLYNRVQVAEIEEKVRQACQQLLDASEQITIQRVSEISGIPPARITNHLTPSRILGEYRAISRNHVKEDRIHNETIGDKKDEAKKSE